MNLNKKYNNIFFWSFLLITILAGLYFRLKGLGKWPLAVDEYYIVKSSENILKYGLPKWDVGGYYTRGLPQQYLTTFLLLLGLKAEFASRIIPVVANLLAIPVLYLIAKKVSGKTLAAALVFVFTFSLWEVEFARFARMYAMFQTIFIWYLYFLYKYILESDDKAFKWLWILSSFSVFVYEGSIFLVLLNFLSIFWDKNKNTFNPFSFDVYRGKVLKILICIGILLIAYGFLTTDFRTLYQQNNLPPDILNFSQAQENSGVLRVPVLLIQTISTSPIWSFLLIIPLSINLFVFYRIVKLETSILKRAAAGILLFFSFLNLLGLVIVALLIFIMIGWLIPEDIIKKSQWEIKIRKIFPSKPIRYFILAGSVNFIFWILFALNTTAWHKFFPNQNISGAIPAIKSLVKESINYPYFYETFVLFRDTVPIITVIYILLIGILFIYIFKKYYDKDVIPLRLLSFLFIFLILMQNTLNLTYFDTRYFFFLYPFILLLSLISLERIIVFFVKKNSFSKVLFGMAVIPLLLFSEDFELKHLLNIDSAEINFRKNLSLPLVIHYYPRLDTEAPDDLVDKESKKDDITITNEQLSEFYLDKLDYIFRDYKGAEFSSESVLKGTKERWTNAKLIYRYSDLNNMIDTSHHRTWLIINTTWAWAVPGLDSLIIKYKPYLYYKSIDGKTLLYKITYKSPYGKASIE